MQGLYVGMRCYHVPEPGERIDMIRDFFRSFKYMTRDEKLDGLWMIICIILFPILYAYIASFFE